MAKIFGIDLGTTYSCIAYVNEYGGVEVVPINNSPVTPSVVAFEAGGGYCVGQTAKEMLNNDPENVCTTIKRQMGKRDYYFEAFGEKYQPETISAFILKAMAEGASQVVGEEVKDVVITCPAYFGLDETNATKKAGEIAGLNVLQVLKEPTAAAISYGIKTDEPQTIMVYDLGGGTFDVTIMKVENNEFKTIAAEGDHQLGGKDWDEVIRQYAIEQYCELTGESSDSLYEDMELMGELELRSENAKKQLSDRENVKIKVNGKNIEISREWFEQETSALLESTLAIVNKAIDEAAKKDVTNFDKILLVGGSTMMPQVQRRLAQEFPSTPIEFGDPNQSVAKGAAIFGITKAAFGDNGGNNETTDSMTTEEKDELRHNPMFKSRDGGSAKPIKIKDVISQSIAVKLVLDDNQEHIVNQIYRNSEFPCEHILDAGTHVANQTSVFIEIFENGSSDEIVPDDLCKKLVDGELGPLPENLPAHEPIQVIFKIDENCLLSIDAAHEASGARKHMEVKLQNEISEEELNQAVQQVTSLHLQK